VSATFFRCSDLLVFDGRPATTDCGNAILNQHLYISQDACSMPCTGNADETCGGSGALQMYWQPDHDFTEGSPSVVTSYKDWTYSGCWQCVFSLYIYSCITLALTTVVHGRDSPQARQITEQKNIPREFMSVETCLEACSTKDYKIAGLQYAEECCESSSLLRVSSSLQSSSLTVHYQGAATVLCPPARSSPTRRVGCNAPTTLRSTVVAATLTRSISSLVQAHRGNAQRHARTRPHGTASSSGFMANHTIRRVTRPTAIMWGDTMRDSAYTGWCV
jgi:hypothetical protein